jgi:bifunctional non-homologous end joining protein LigD
MSAKKADRVPIGGISLSSPGRVVYPENGVTKLEIARYYEAVGEWLLPHFRHRPLTLVRCPDTYKQCFFQKHIDENRVYAALHAIPIQEGSGVGYYPSVDSIEGVLSLVQLGALEFHTSGCRKDRLEQPDKFTMDIDPDPSVSWPRVVRTAQVIRELLAELGLVSFVKTTGGKGLHVVVPLQRRRKWEEIRAFTEGIAALLVQAAPKEYVMTLSKAKRAGKILVDYLRNARGATAIEAYSTRARVGATVSAPISWDELTPKLDPAKLNVRTVPKRMVKLGADPWATYGSVRQTITAKAFEQVVGSRS